jgi:hypothetical protein
MGGGGALVISGITNRLGAFPGYPCLLKVVPRVVAPRRLANKGSPAPSLLSFKKIHPVTYYIYLWERQCSDEGEVDK